MATSSFCVSLLRDGEGVADLLGILGRTTPASNPQRHQFRRCRPYLADRYFGIFPPDDPYKIATKADLLALAADKNDYSKYFILTADIDMGGRVFTTAIIAAGGATVFTGTFDGNGHKIAHFTINGGTNNYIGLFGLIGSGGFVKNLGLENCAVSGHWDVGGLVGGTYGGSVNNSFWDTQTSGRTTSAGGTGKTTAQTKTLSTFTSAGWDFVYAWGIGNGQTYPYLKPFNGINPADIDYSGTVDFADFAILASHWLEGTEP